MYENVYQNKTLYPELNNIEQLRLEHVNIIKNELVTNICNEEKKVKIYVKMFLGVIFLCNFFQVLEVGYQLSHLYQKQVQLLELLVYLLLNFLHKTVYLLKYFQV